MISRNVDAYKYSTGSKSSERAAIQSRAAGPRCPANDASIVERGALGAMAVFAGIVGDVPALTHASMCCRASGMVALGASCHMPAERLSSAGLNGRHHLQLVQADMSLVGPTPFGPIIAKDISNFQRAFWHADTPVRSDPARAQTG